MKVRSAILALAAGLSLAALPVFAHHSFAAEFDDQKPLSFTGTVTKLDWSNPHSHVYIDVKDDKGKVTNWEFQLGSVNALVRHGWSKNSVKPGDVISIEGYQAKDGANRASATGVTVSDKHGAKVRLEGKDFRLAEEITYIQRRAAKHDGQFLAIGPLVFFSTDTGDAWLLRPAEHYAAQLAKNGAPVPLKFEENDNGFNVEWKGTYQINGAAFLYLDKGTGQVNTFFGYPAARIAQIG
ncbi:MAG: DUF6152 family protein [Bryobacteraceae bacterium]